MDFAENILHWYKENKRDLPWRQTKNPYKIWLSEIIMQQTQIAQGTSYYLKFIDRFPTVNDLAKAKENDVLLLWQGLGYYTRARNLHKTAKEIVIKHKGNFPDSYSELIKLKGIGDYTASAILSVCFNKPHPAIDGNVIRVISRIFEIFEDLNTTKGKSKIKTVTTELISQKEPGDFNQAIMDYGSQICKPKNPKCDTCIFTDICMAYKNLTVHKLPVKKKAKPKEKEYICYFICLNENEDKIIISKRTQGIWKNLYDFPSIISKKKPVESNLLKTFTEETSLTEKINLLSGSSVYRHMLTHKELHIKFFKLKIISKDDFKRAASIESSISIKKRDLNNFPFPVVIKDYIDKNIFGKFIPE